MSLVLPSEIVVERLLPTVRAMLAARLRERGLTQQEIADHLGVTQAAVSKYVSGRATVEERFRENPRTAATADRIADGLASGSMDGYDALAELLELIREFEDRGPICELHEAEMPALRGLGCDLCVRGVDAEVEEERDALASVREATRILATAPGMAGYVPNVGTNAGTALPDAADPTGVAAVPGRIYAVDGRVEVPANPEFGASRHVATAILAANDADPAVRGAVNVATREDLLAAARGLGVDPLEFDADYDDRGERLRGLFRDRGVPPVVYHRGAFGIEPITYVFGETAAEAAELAANLVAAAEDSA
ncbi:thiamine-phosphate synthase family protein [Halorarum salinum]|uniref:Helix-turn-helix domain-containing protein n=1 Tax=Halorarum salinum TaxID=2743089 RepID=A0A7D5LDW2_9EURY|nr:thiamine-phosphate synthase family protein [Halobaculum salinum]QLG63675.1 helix-turn-helix domain-containing protein [Halobaculum salinum]